MSSSWKRKGIRCGSSTGSRAIPPFSQLFLPFVATRSVQRVLLAERRGVLVPADLRLRGEPAQLVHLVAQLRRVLEVEGAGGLLHLLLQAPDDLFDLRQRQRRRVLPQAGGGVGRAVFRLLLRDTLRLNQVADGLADRLRRDAVFLIEGDLLLAA